MKKKQHEVNLQVRWRNFRAFSDTGWVTLKPLTILIGPNGAGKSSVIAPLLLLNQTILSRDTATSLLTRGDLVDAGTFENVIQDHDTARELSLALRFHVHEPKPRALKPVGAYPPGALEVVFGNTETPHVPALRTYSVRDLYDRPFFARKARNGSGRFTLSGINSNQMLPREREAINKSMPFYFMFNATRELSVMMPQDTEEPPIVEFSDQFSLYISAVSFVFNRVRSFLDNLSYIGPLRERPRYYYEVAAERPRTVGPSGDRAANLLRTRYAEFKTDIDKWLRHFELGDRVRFENLAGDLFHVLFVSDATGRETNIAEAGFGASQVLPLIVQAVASEKDSLTIAEQPEIHLNPRLQANLADLLVYMANNDRQVIVETHSEHLLLRLRRLIASGEISNNDVALYFVEQRGTRSSIREVSIATNGHIPTNEWPVGFFGETLRESLALAATQASQ